jgi:hypothetical protein
MAICEWCQQDTAKSCTANTPVEIDGKVYSPIPADEDCGDCGVGAGGLHHLGCDIETCPCCGEQRSFCNCANPTCPACGVKMEYAGADDVRAYYECPSCGAED